MDSLNEMVKEYSLQLNKGKIQKAYRGIMMFMSDLRSYLEEQYPKNKASSIYFGYMDMTYFAFTPAFLLERNLKVAIVYLHEQGRFEIWLGGSNRNIQAEYIEIFREKNLGDLKLSAVQPGVDSILVSTLEEMPDFDRSKTLMKQIESRLIDFTNNINSLLSQSAGE